MELGRIRYSLMTNEDGGILDDVLVYHIPDLAGRGFFMMVVNASNRDKIRNWIESSVRHDESIELEDRTRETAMIACQGPKANSVVAKLSDLDPATLKYYTGASTQVCGRRAIMSRTGYTGEDGCELIVTRDQADEIWSELYRMAAAEGGTACGLAARDTLRLEAAMPLYGHELSEDINAAQTDLDFAINLKDRNFVGKIAILSARKSGALPVRVGLELEGRRVARENCELIHESESVGKVTSGTFSPSLNKSIAMGYVDRRFAEPGWKLEVDIRGKYHRASVVKLPFYHRQ
jgi:aminomethyltransferase